MMMMLVYDMSESRIQRSQSAAATIKTIGSNNIRQKQKQDVDNANQSALQEVI
jgi:hypothetical protein